MKGGKRPLGYTIIEVLIVLAVSGLIFIIAANFINGKQARVSFQQGVNEFDSRIQGVISDVTDGHYSDIPFTCKQTGAGPLQITSTAKEQGTNPECVFMGKMFHFRPNDPRYEVFSLAGAREKFGGGPVTVFPAEAQMTVIDLLTTQSNIPQSLDVLSMKVINGSGGLDNNRWTIGFVQGLGVADTAGGGQNYTSGGQTIRMVYASSVGPGQPIPLAAGPVNASISAANGVTFCVTDGTRYARVSVGTNTAGATTDTNSQFDVRTQIVSNESGCTS